MHNSMRFLFNIEIYSYCWIDFKCNEIVILKVFSNSQSSLFWHSWQVLKEYIFIIFQCLRVILTNCIFTCCIHLSFYKYQHNYIKIHQRTFKNVHNFQTFFLNIWVVFKMHLFVNKWIYLNFIKALWSKFCIEFFSLY